MISKKINRRKGEFLPRKWVVALLIFSSMFALLFVSSQSFFQEYGRDDLVDNTYQENYDKFSETSQEFRTLFADMSEDPGFLDLAEGIFKALFKVIELLWESVLSLDDITEQFMSDFGVPEEISNIIFPMLSVILAVLLIFAVISSVNRGSKL